jgi:hypothetical protein
MDNQALPVLLPVKPSPYNNQLVIAPITDKPLMFYHQVIISVLPLQLFLTLFPLLQDERGNVMDKQELHLLNVPLLKPLPHSNLIFESIKPL